ncbi:hypothetical protein AAC387_Pa02g2825 [Persea americana]
MFSAAAAAFPPFPPPPSQPLPTILPDANCIAPLPQQPIASLPSPTSNRPPSCSITLEEENSKASPGPKSQIGFPSNPAPVWQVRKPQAASASPAPAMVQPPLQSSPTWDPASESIVANALLSSSALHSSHFWVLPLLAAPSTTINPSYFNSFRIFGVF